MNFFKNILTIQSFLCCCIEDPRTGCNLRIRFIHTEVNTFSNTQILRKISVFSSISAQPQAVNDARTKAQKAP